MSFSIHAYEVIKYLKEHTISEIDVDVPLGTVLCPIYMDIENDKNYFIFDKPIPSTKPFKINKFTYSLEKMLSLAVENKYDLAEYELWSSLKMTVSKINGLIHAPHNEKSLLVATLFEHLKLTRTKNLFAAGFVTKCYFEWSLTI